MSYDSRVSQTLISKPHSPRTEIGLTDYIRQIPIPIGALPLSLSSKSRPPSLGSCLYRRKGQKGPKEGDLFSGDKVKG